MKPQKQPQSPLAKGARSQLLNQAVIGGTLLVLALTAYFILFPSRSFFHADCTDTIFWAQASLDAKAIFNPDFSYAGLAPFGGYLFMLPFVAIFGVSMTAQVLGMLFFFLLFSLAAFYMLKHMGWSNRWSALALSLLLLTLSASEKLREIFWSHIIYYSLGILFLFAGLALVFKALNLAEANTQTGRRFPLTLALTGIWFTLCATNQVESLTIFCLPAIAGVVGERFLDFTKNNYSPNQKHRERLVFGAMTFGTLIGTALGFKLKSGYTAGYQSAYSSFGSIDELTNNIFKFLPQWLTLLGVNIVDGDALFSPTGLINLLFVAGALILLIAPFITTLLYYKLNNRPSRILIIAHWVMTGMILLGYLFGRLSSANWRLSPIVCTSVILTAMLCRYIYQKTNKQRLLVILLTPLLLMGLVTGARIATMNPTGSESHLFVLSDYLEEHDLTYGYATFWNANSITVISDSEVLVRHVSVEDGVCSINPYQSNKNWYKDVEGQQRYFLLLSEDEFASLRQAGNLSPTDAVETLYTQGYTILVFDKNIF